ncbi:MAG: DUF4126 domain-containing protein [Gemmatimonadota bacterium]|nr:DUF4126 domain-containing protein [Gemmatimonadota bacterium]
MIELPIELLALPPLALAAGLDLYLTLLFIGAAPTTGLWALPLPGALGDLDPPSVLITVGAFYLAEFAAERFPPAALVWNAFHAIIRPVSGALLALLLLDGQPVPMLLVGAVLAGALASLAHGARSGAWAIRVLRGTDSPSPLLLSVAEDVVVLGAVALALDRPSWAFVASLAVLAALAPATPFLLRAFAYSIRLGVARAFRTLGRRRWRRSDELPARVRDALHDNDEALAHGAALRGCPVGAWRLDGAPLFAVGWLVVHGTRAAFVLESRRRSRRIDLEGYQATSVTDLDLFRRIEFADRPRSFVIVGANGPSTEGLSAEFLGE